MELSITIIACELLAQSKVILYREPPTVTIDVFNSELEKVGIQVFRIDADLLGFRLLTPEKQNICQRGGIMPNSGPNFFFHNLEASSKRSFEVIGPVDENVGMQVPDSIATFDVAVRECLGID